MGCSYPSWFFCSSTPATLCSEENEKMRKYLEKYGLARIGASDMAFFIPSNYFLALGIHLISWYFHSMLVMYLTISANETINHLRKFTFPGNYWTSSFFWGSSILIISSTLLGSILMPYWEIIFPSRFPSFIEKNKFLGFREMLNFLYFLNILNRWETSYSSELEKIVKPSR